MAKKGTHRTPEEKQTILQGLSDARQTEPGLSFHLYAKRVGLSASMLRGWARKLGRAELIDTSKVDMTNTRKKTRNNRTPEEKTAIVQGFLDARKKNKGVTLAGYCARVGIVTNLLRNWMTERGIDVSLKKGVALPDVVPGSVPGSVPVSAVAPAAPVANNRAGNVLAPDSGWLASHGATLRAGMGLDPDAEAETDSDAEPGTEQTSQTTLLSRPEGPALTRRGKKIGRPTDAERAERRAQEAHEREQARSGAGLSRLAFERQEPPRQPELPFRAEPVRREEPQRNQEREQPPPSEYLTRVTEQALKERDAFRTVLEVLMRENGGKFPGM